MSHRIEGVPLNMTSNREIYNVKSPATVHKLNNTNSIVDEKKREKKWSIGGLFRRRKKEVDSESSSEENAEHIRKGGFMARRKAKKELKKKKKPMLGTFDVVVTRNDNYFHYPDQHCDPTAVLSDPNTGFIGYCDRGLPTKKDNSVEENIDVLSKSSKESLNPGKDTSLGSSSLDSASRKSHRERAKARVEAKRDRIYNESSSDEGSQRSNSSSVAKFKSDDSISKSQRDSSLNRKTRGARTERYIKRITRDDEIQLNQEADQKHIKLNRVPNRSPSASPVLKSKHRSDNSLNSSISQSMISSSATIPPSHYPPNRILIEQQHNQHFNCPLQKPPTAAISSNRFMSQTHMHLHRTVPNEYYMPNQKSLSYENHINRTSQSSPINGNCVQRNLSLNQVYPPNHPRSPPPPPPRDPQRKLFSAACDNRPMSYAFENKHQRVNNQNNQFSSPQNVNRSSSIRSVNYPPTSKNNSYNWHQPYINFRSNSDDHVQQIITPHLQARPASVTSEIAPKRFITRRSNELSKYQYFTDKTPRSRKPIHISNATTVSENPYLSDSQVVTTCSYIDKHPVQLATEFWRQKEKEELLRKKLEIEKLHNEKKDLINKKNETVNLIKPTVIHQNITPSPLPNNVVNNSQINLKIIEKSDNSMMIPHRNTNLPGEKSNLPLKQGSNVHRQIEERSNISNRSCSRQSSVSSNGSLDLNNDNKEHSKRRKSTNLEDALDELEAIYKSLRLGDEDLLERAEERDLTVSQSKTEHYAKWNTSRGTQSDSGYNYTRDSSSVESLIDCDVPLRVSRLSRKPCNADKVADDMALRRLRKIDKSSNQESIPRSSYLLTSPALSDKVFNYDTIPSNDEPNIVLDDMMYRNMKHSINTLKINDPQPLFGIPLGPISPAPNSDYLHVIPENKYRSRFIPQKLPDVIKDDLAFRSLRKDHSKDTTLPSLSSDDFVNNNNNITKNENFSLKKKRAVRSLSANIYNLINRDIVKSPNIERQEFEKAQSFSDINDAIQMAQKILKDREVIGGKSCRISSNSPTSTETLTGSTILCGNSKSNQNLPLASDKTNLQQRLRVYIAPKSDDIVSQKPPLPQSLDRSSKPPTKESTPARISPDLNEHNTKMDKDKLQDILTALANEAHETSEKLELELEQMKVNSNQDTHSKDKIQHIENVSNTNTSKQIGYVKDVAEIVEPKTVSINTKENFINIDQKLSDIDAVSEHAKLCEKLLECVVESTELIGPKTLEIEKCFDNDSLELSFEEVEQFDKFEKPSQSVANIILTRNADLPSEILLDSVDSDRLSTEIICTKPESSYEDDGIVTSFSNESDIDSTLSEQNESKIKERNNSKSPFEIHKEALLHEFAELKKKLTENEYISETDIQYKKNYLYGNTNENSSQRNSYTIPNAVSPEENANNNLSSSPVENDIEMKRDTDVLIQFAELPKEDLNSSTNVNSEILQISSSSDSEVENCIFEYKRRSSDNSAENIFILDNRSKVKHSRYSFRKPKHKLLRPLSCSSLPSLLSADGHKLTERALTMSSSELFTNNVIAVKMADLKANDTEKEKADRVKRYKEQRRQQLEAQFANLCKDSNSSLLLNGNGVGESTGVTVRRYISRVKHPSATSTPVSVNSNRSSGGECGGVGTQRVRTTRASRLRAAASSASNVGTPDSLTSSPSAKEQQLSRRSPHVNILTSTPTTEIKERSPAVSDMSVSRPASTRTLERDKSSKRKSNLNRSLNSEEVNEALLPESAINRRRQRQRSQATVTTLSSIHAFDSSSNVKSSTPSSNMLSSPFQSRESEIALSPSINNTHSQSTSDSSSLPKHLDSSISSTPFVSSSLPVSSPLNISSKNIKRRPSELSIHMENARRSISGQGLEGNKEHLLSRRHVSPSIKSKIDSKIKKPGNDSNVTMNKDMKTHIETKVTKPSLDKIKNRYLNESDFELRLKNRLNDSDSSTDKKIKSKVYEKLPSDALKENTKCASTDISKCAISNISSSEENKINLSDTAKRLNHPVNNGVRKLSPETKFRKKSSSSSSADDNKIKGTITKSNDLSRKMDALAALTKETLSRVERLTGKSKSDRKQDSQTIITSSRNSCTKYEVNQNYSLNNSKHSSKKDTLDLTSLKTSNSQDQAPTCNNSAKKIELLSNSSRRTSTIQTVDNVEDTLSEPTHEEPKADEANLSCKKTSILKKKSIEEVIQISNQNITGPISILKRKSIPQHDLGSSNTSTSLSLQPVTFSPSVIDPPKSRKRPGILKKRCSLDESEVLRQRSCSPSTILDGNYSDFKPILKNQRRSSLEEICIRSPDLQPHGILKRKASRVDDEAEDRSLGSPEPQGILKRKSGTSSSGSSTSPHVSIMAAVVLAAAEGAEIISEATDIVRPILKKKSFSEEYPITECTYLDSPKPILKKKSSTDTEEQDDKPMKPILKSSRKSSLADSSVSPRDSSDCESPRRSIILKNCSESANCDTVRPILKQKTSRENSPKPRSSVGNESTNSDNYSTAEMNDSNNDMEELNFENTNSRQTRSKQPLRTVCPTLSCDKTDVNLQISSLSSRIDVRKENLDILDKAPTLARKLSVAERVLNMENFLAQEKQTRFNTGAIPKRSHFRTKDVRYKTQPVTAEEIKSSSSRTPCQFFSSDHSTSEVSKTEENISDPEHSLINISYDFDRSFNNHVPITIQTPEEDENNQFSRTILRSPTLDTEHNYQCSQQLPKSNSSVQLLLTANDSNNHNSTSDIDTLSIDISSSQLVLDLNNSSDIISCNEHSLSSISLPSESGDSGVNSATTSKMSTNDSAMNESDDKNQVQDGVTELCRSNSVSAKASLFKQLEEQMKNNSEEAKNVNFRSGKNRFRSSNIHRSIDHRFSTQPVTLDEVQEATRQNEHRNVESENSGRISNSSSFISNVSEDNDESDPSKLSLAERVKLFNTKITEERFPNKLQGVSVLPPTRKRHNRFKTQPVTTEEVEFAQRINPLMASFMKHPNPEELEGISIHAAKEKIHEHAVKMLTSEVKGILKSKSAIYPILNDESTSELSKKQLKSVLKKDSLEHTPYSSFDETQNSQQLKSILKIESSEHNKNSSKSAEKNEDARKSLIGSRKSSETTDIISILHDAEEKAKLHNLQNERNLKSNSNIKEELSDSHDQCNVTDTKNISTYDANQSQKDLLIERKMKQTFSNKISQVSKNIENVLNAEVLSKCMSGPVNMKKTSAKTSDEPIFDDSVKSNYVSDKKSSSNQEYVMSSSNDTSEGESSGGREVRKIIKNEAVARRRQAALTKHNKQCLTPPARTILSKSNSYSAVGSLASSVSAGSPNKESSEESVRVSREALGGVATRSGVSVRRSRTLGGVADVASAMSIADRCAALKNAGDNDWKRRIPKLNSADDELKTIQTKNLINETNHNYSKDEHNKHLDIISIGGNNSPSILADRVCRLETASQEWKKRVEQTDAVKFSVAGRMEEDSIPSFEEAQFVNSPLHGTKNKPNKSRFRSKYVIVKSASSTPVSPEKNSSSFKRSASIPGANTDEQSESNNSKLSSNRNDPLVEIPKADNETFTSFFPSVTKIYEQFAPIDISSADFDAITDSSNSLVVQKRVLKVQRRYGTSRNPLRTLSARTDLLNEYVEVKTGIAEKEARRLKSEQLAKNSSLAIEALAGLASKEDFTAISLKKTRSTATTSMLPYKDLMLLHVKGRRYIQTRLVEPTASSINKGDSYILITPTEIYNYVGLYSNVIEQSRSADISSHIQQYKDLGCSASKVITLHENKTPREQLEQFWNLLGTNIDNVSVVNAGHPDEDELYELKITETNKVYELQDDELVPCDAYWGTVLKIDILDPSKILIFDFGVELYIWNGKNTSLDRRKTAVKLAKELWDEGYDYSECDICPISIAAILGIGKFVETNKSGKRPEWTLLAKVTQNMETVLFREKFIDWPDFTRVIQVKEHDLDKSSSLCSEINPCDVSEMISANFPDPDLILDGSHLGRGLRYFDLETNRHFEITTTEVTAWHIQEFDYEKLDKKSLGHFFTGDTFIIRWQYKITITGRELSGLPSRHSSVGRDRCAYFCWQGHEASLNEKGAGALLTIELDHERGPQVRITEGSEQPAFLNLFEGKMVIHAGKREEMHSRKNYPWRLYLCRGNVENETVLIEVPCDAKQLRSRISFILINTDLGTITVWHGSQALKNAQMVCLETAKKIKMNKSIEFGFNKNVNITINEVMEGAETKEVSEILGLNQPQMYMSLVNDKHVYDKTPRLFHLSSILGEFQATEILCPYRSSDTITPYPFMQSDLYSASQPALFLFDNIHTLWLWQGWWPERDSENLIEIDPDNSLSQTGSGSVRFQAERRAAMHTALSYWQEKTEYSTSEQSSLEDNKTEKIISPPVYLVWAGLEPLEFTNMFPTWIEKEDIAALNIKEGKKQGEILHVERELTQLTRSSYTLSELMQRPLPDGVDPTRLEDYLPLNSFSDLFGVSKEEFTQMPAWKRTEMKKDVGLF